MPTDAARSTPTRPTRAQIAWLRRGLGQPGGKLPLFDENGQRVNERMVRACIAHGWAQHWFENPIKPDWLVCKLSAAGRDLAQAGDSGQAAAPMISGTRLSTSTGVSK